MEDNLFNKKLWIARDEATFEDSNEREYYIEHKDENILNLKGELNIFYDKPLLDCNENGEHIWTHARKIASLPSYMFPEIKCEQCAVFVPKEIID